MSARFASLQIPDLPFFGILAFHQEQTKKAGQPGNRSIRIIGHSAVPKLPSCCSRKNLARYGKPLKKQQKN